MMDPLKRKDLWDQKGTADLKDLFQQKNIKPMLIGAEGQPFDDPDYIYELKLDGERCIAYLDPKTGTELRNKRNEKMLPKVPELSNLHKQVKKKCILDGELIVMKDGVPDFNEIKRRSLMSNRFKIELAAAKFPACFTAYDVLYLDDHPITEEPLMERKKKLSNVIQQENERLALSRIIENHGIALYHLAEQKDLEGIVAKRKDSLYNLGKRTKDWVKIKNLQDDDFVVCGYILKSEHVTSIVLGQYCNNRKRQNDNDSNSSKNRAELQVHELVYKGHVTLGISREDFSVISNHPKIPAPLFLSYPSGSGNDQAIWIQPDLVCTVKYMQKTSGGGLRQPVFKSLRSDKNASECIEDTEQ